MKRLLIQIVILSAVFGHSYSFAAVSDINFDKLNEISRIDELKKNISDLESVAHDWSHEWKYDVPKEQAIDLAKKTIRMIDEMINDKPDLFELLILKGIAAAYAYNLDLQEYTAVAEKSFNAAQALAPDDIRPLWFLGKHLTQSARSGRGMQAIDEVFKKNKPENLPPRFFEDYAFCAYMAAMPSSALMGIKFSEQKAPSVNPIVKTLKETLESKMMIPSTTQAYEYKTVWSAETIADGVRFTNRMFGFSFTILGNWQIGFSNIKNGKCGVNLGLPGKKGASPNIRINAEIIDDKLSLESFIKKHLSDNVHFQQIPNAFKLPETLVFEGKYSKKRQKAYALAIGLIRQEPAYPGIAFEHPSELPLNKKGEPQFFTAQNFFARFKRPIVYMIMFDTPESVYPAAKKELDTFVSGFLAE